MNSRLIERVELLIQQDRYKEANEILPEIIASDPNNAHLLALYSNVLLQLDEFKRANEVISTAIGIQPDNDYLYYIKAVILIHQEKYDESEKFLNEAIAIDPTVPTYYAYLASIKLARKQFEKALELADKALSLNPENIDALNTRSAALMNLDYKEDAFKTIEGALKENPNNPHTHANYGWSLLKNGENVKALEHFKEALKNNPNLETAQIGMVEALKAKYLLYRLFLKYTFWIGKMTSKYQWGFVIGFYLSVKVLRGVAKASPVLEPIIMPIVIILALMAFSTWIITPISNLFLRLNVYGRNLLDKKEIMSSNFVGFSILILLLGLAISFFMKEDKWLSIAIFGFGMMIPFSAMFAPTKHKNLLFGYIGVMVLIGLLSIWDAFHSGVLINIFTLAFVIALVAFQWITNFLFIREDNI